MNLNDDLLSHAGYLDDPDALEPLPAARPAGRPLDVPAEMVVQVATGLEDPVVVAGRFGFTPDEFAVLASWKPFQDQVEAKRTELQRSGVTFRIQCAFMAEDLAKDVYKIAKGNDITLPQKLETFRTMAKLADLEPKPAQTTQQGTGFQININIPPPAAPTLVVSEQ